jgi:hypothetical protein
LPAASASSSSSSNVGHLLQNQQHHSRLFRVLVETNIL